LATSSGNYTSEALLATDRYFKAKVVDQLFKSNALLYLMRRNPDLLDGGASIELPHLIAESPDFSWFTEYGDYDVSAVQQFDAARLEWKYGTQPVLISEAEMLKNSSSKLRRMRHVRLKNQAAAKTMADKIATAMFSLEYGNALAIDGIDRAVNDNAGSGAESTALGFTYSSTPTYAGITRATSGVGLLWNSDVDDTTTDTSMGALQQSYGDASEGEDQPTVAVTSQNGFNRYWELLTPTQRQGTQLDGAGGFKALMFNGIPVIVDSHVPRYLGVNDTDADNDQDYWYFLNLNYLKITAHQDAYFRFRPSPMPINQWVHVGRYYFMGNIVCDAPRFQSKLTRLTA
jgi:hypothetical protein